MTTALAETGINIVALTMTDTVEHGVLRFVCDEPNDVRSLLARTNDQWTETDVIVMELQNRPGSFAEVAQALAEAHINIAYAYITGGVGDGRTNAVFKVADTNKAHKILSGLHKASGKGKRKGPPRTGQ